MEAVLQKSLEQLIGARLEKALPVSGGDIARAYLLHTSTDRLFCKYFQDAQAYDMFRCEKDGLEAIRASGHINAPKVHFCDHIETGAVLIMEFIEAQRPSASDMFRFGGQLAMMHKEGGAEFGWETDNYIGSLTQSNNRHIDWVDFFVEERLEPQLEMARKKALLSTEELPSRELMKNSLNEIASGIKPSLLHGDLWAGNYLISTGGVPYLIDPATYFGHSEIDIAMSRLFGGFQDSFYEGYEEILPSEGPLDDRIRVYQLYYLLVHLNLFGGSYYSGVKAILKSYF
jgi:fructosamine-3-kinase